MNATRKSWLNRMMNRGAGAVKALGFTTRRPSRMLQTPFLRTVISAVAVSGALGTFAWGQTPADDGVVKLGGGAARVQQTQGSVRLGDPSGTVGPQPSMMMAQAPMVTSPYSGVPMPMATPGAAFQAPQNADRTLMNFDQGVGYAQTKDVTSVLYRVGTTQGTLYGNQGQQAPYTNISAFIPIATDDSSVWWIQPRANVTNGGSGVANFGTGYRFYTPDDNRVWGASFWWDGDGGHHSWYNQLGGHFSSVGQFLSWRGGFAMPIGTTNDKYGSALSNLFYVNDNIGYNVASTLETAYRRYDLEAATPVPMFGRYGWEMGVGVYYLDASTNGVQKSAGVSGRLEAQVTEDFWINGVVTTDEIFGGRFSLNMELTLPDGAPSRWMRPKRVKDALTASDKRNYRVAAHRQTVLTQGLALDPDTGLPIKVAHIDPNQTAPGTGTVLNPFMSIAEFEGLADPTQALYNIIFVEPRTDKSDTNLNTGVTLFDRQRLLGNGLGTNTFSAIVNGSFQSGLLLPGQFTSLTSAGAFDPTGLPLLTNSGNPAADIVTLANLNEVAGFQIDNSAGGIATAGIRGTGIDSFDLHDLYMQTASIGISITSDTSPVLGVPREDYGIIQNVTVSAATGDPATFGIQVVHTAGTLDLLLEDNTVTDIGGETLDTNANGTIDPGVGIAIVSSGTGVIHAADYTSQTRPTGILGNTVSGSDTNLQLTALNGGEFDALLTGSAANANGNQITDNTDANSAGFVALADNGTMNLSVAGNSFLNNAGDGIRMGSANGGHLVVPQSETITGGILNDINGNGVQDLGFVNNVITGNNGAGVRVLADGPGSLTEVSIGSGNTISNNTLDAVVFEANNGGTINVGELLLGSAITNNGGAIIRVAGDGGIINLGTISNTVFDRRVSGSAGILFDATDATITGVISGNQFLGSTNNGNTSFGIGGEIRGGTLDLTIDNNLFNGNVNAAIGLIISASDDRPAPGTGTPLVGDAAEAKVVITNNTIINTRVGSDSRFNGDGIALILEGQQQDTGVPPSDPTNTIQPAARLEGLIAGNLIGVTDPNNITTVQGNAGSGVYIELNGDSAIADLAGILSPIDDPELDGLYIGAKTYQGINYGANAFINNNQGISVRRFDSATIDNFVINTNLIQNNLNDGINIASDNGGIPYGDQDTLNFTITNNSILNNGFQTNGTQGTAGRGITMRADGSSVIEIDISNNLIDGNRMGGIEARTGTSTHSYTSGIFPSGDLAGHDDAFASGGGDNGVIFGVWQLNSITNNGFISTEDANHNGKLDAGEDANGNGVLDAVTQGHGIALGRIDWVDPDAQTGLLEGFNNGAFLLPNGSTPILSILDNNISGNGRDGIHMYLDKTQVFSTSTSSLRTTRVDIQRNDIVNNGEDGFNIHNSSGLGAKLFAEFSNNLVSKNGVYSGNFSFLQGPSASLATVTPSSDPNQPDTVVFSEPLFNPQTSTSTTTVPIIGDGIEIVTSGVGETTIEANNNRIIQNNGRGVNILTAGTGHLVGFWDSNYIAQNTREGFYTVNAQFYTRVVATTGNNFALPAGTQLSGYDGSSWLADTDSNHEMFNYGHNTAGPLAVDASPPTLLEPFLIDYVNNNIGPGPVTELVLTNNNILNNGGVVQDADFRGRREDPYTTMGGLVMRVGTTGIEDPSLSSVPNWLNGIGGMIARIDNNKIAGNSGTDVYFDGFNSVEPPTVDTRPDPLIRFDLVFTNNRGGSIDVSGDNFAVFFVNTNTDNGGTNQARPNPPFNPSNQPRDATRNLGDPGQGQLPFPGFGTPTIRVEQSGSALNAQGVFLGNNLFNLIYSDFTPATTAPPDLFSSFGLWETIPDGTVVVPTLPPVFP